MKAKIAIALVLATIGCKQRSGAGTILASSTAQAAPSGVPGLNDLITASNQSVAQGATDTRFVPTPLIRQSQNFTCGVVALQSVLMFWGNEIREGQLAVTLQTTAADGTSYLQMVKLLDRLTDPSTFDKNWAAVKAVLSPAEAQEAAGLVDTTPSTKQKKKKLLQAVNGAYTYTLRPGTEHVDADGNTLSDSDQTQIPKDGMSVQDLEAAIQRGHPTIVLIQGWLDTPTTDVKKLSTDYIDGHFVVAIGYDQTNFYFMDPSTTGNYTFIPRDEFVVRWHDSDDDISRMGQIPKNWMRHFGLEIWKDQPSFALDAITKIL